MSNVENSTIEDADPPVDASSANNAKSDEELSTCLACKKPINDGRANSIQCYLCKGWSHMKCSVNKEVFDLLAKISKKDSTKKRSMVTDGMVSYICGGCQVSIQLMFNPSDVRTTKNQDCNVTKRVANKKKISIFTQTVLEKTSSEVKHCATQVQLTATPPYETAVKINNPTFDDNYRQHTNNSICYNYRKGKCRHGQSGNKLVYGQKCNFLHPQKCLKYCRFGHDKRQGCNGPCDLLHPILCRNSVKYNKCLNENCTFAHLSGTERYERQQILPQMKNFTPFFKLDDGNVQNHQQFRSRNFERQQSFKPLAHSKPDLQRNKNQGFSYHESDFPALPLSQEYRMNEMSTAIKQMQKCLDYLMYNSNNNCQPQNSSHQQFNSQTYYPSQQPPINNQHQSNYILPQQMSSTAPSHQVQAKN